jgi:hypothetical protein
MIDFLMIWDRNQRQERDDPRPAAAGFVLYTQTESLCRQKVKGLGGEFEKEGG